MLGFYDYTVILTYLSLLSAGVGTAIALGGLGHPYYGCFFLLFCGLCDAFDGKVARTKKDRSEDARAFGVQIDSLSDLVAFGVLPAAIGAAMLRRSALPALVSAALPRAASIALTVFAFALLAAYVLAALIRLAWFNVEELKRQRADDGSPPCYLGLPVTTSALIFPFIMLLQYIIPADVTPVYLATAAVTAAAFVTPFRIKKPSIRGVLIMVGIGAVEFLFMLIGRALGC